MSRRLSRRFAGSSPKVAFTPAALIGNGLVLWLRGDLGITLNGATVSAWADQSGSGRDFTQATAIKQPTQSTAIGGKACVHYSGSTYLTRTADFAAGAKTIVIVRNNTGGGMGIQVCTGSLITCVSYGHFDAVFRFVADANATPANDMTTTQGLTGSHVDYVDYNAGSNISAASYNDYLDGTSATVAAEARALGNLGNADPSAIGAEILGGSPFVQLTGDIAEILVCSRQLTTAERNNLSGYFQTRYAITMAGATF